MYLTDWQSGRHPDSVWFALKDRPITFWNWLVCQGPHIGKLPCWGMYQGTHWTLVRALKNNNFKKENTSFGISCLELFSWKTTSHKAELDRIANMDQIPNTELFGFWKWTNTEFRIILFGLNYSNTEYLTSNSTPKKFSICEFCGKSDEDTLILYFHTYMRAFYCVFYTYLAYKKF